MSETTDPGPASPDIQSKKAMHKEINSFTVTPVRSQQDLTDTLLLFNEYAASLGFDLSFQDFAAEMQGMPGKYAPPRGELLLARDEQGTAVGCVGLRPLARDGVCEMKRLYVSPTGRGSGVGKALATRIIEMAETMEYDEMRLDSIPSMKAALAMYRAFGFETIDPYYETPLAGTHFLSLKLPREKEGGVVLPPTTDDSRNPETEESQARYGMGKLEETAVPLDPK